MLCYPQVHDLEHLEDLRPTLAHVGAAYVFPRRGSSGCGDPKVCNTKGYSSTYLAMGFANVRAGTRVLMLVLVQATRSAIQKGTRLLTRYGIR